jgi:general nucleoside transport system permease protein
MDISNPAREKGSMLMDILVSGIRMATPLILVGLGGLISLQTGDLNIALEGFMLVGAFFAIVGSYLFASALMGVVFAIFFTVLFAVLFSYFVITLKSDVFVVGIAMNLMAAGGTVYLSRMIFNVKGSFSSPRIAGLPNIHVAFLDEIPVLSHLLNNHSLFVYLSWIFVLLFWILIYKTPYGYYFRAAGEHPLALETAGVRVNTMRWVASLLCGVMCGMAGAHLSLGYLRLFVENMTAGRGFIALAAVIFGGTNPLWMACTALLFGIADGASLRIQNAGIPAQVTLMLPYLATILALILRSATNRRFRQNLYR